MAKRISPDRLTGRIEQILNEAGEKHLPMNKIEDYLHLRKGDRTAFLLALHGLEMDGRVKRDPKGRYYRPQALPHSKRETVAGELTALHLHFGFVALDDKRGDCFIPGDSLNGALPGDRVEVLLIPGDRRGLSGRITAVTQSGERVYVGRMYEENRRLFVSNVGAFRYDLPLLRRSAEGMKAGDMIRFSVTTARSGDLMAVAESSYGDGDSARVCADALIDRYGIPTSFSEEVLAQAAYMADLPVNLEAEGREDLRNIPLFTIDGADAKDLDDAVSLQRDGEGWLLGVHIADVSYYVTPNGPLDKAALERGTSVYFADRVIPMLPPILSNGACSLNPDEDKRAFSAMISLDEKGEITACRLTKSLIRSRVRGVYSEVNSLFDGTATATIQQKYRPVADQLESMRCLAQRMEQAAVKRGILQLESVESRISLDENGEAVAVVLRSSGEAERLIERLMITANTAVAALAKEQRLPFVYRVHETPNTERLGQLFDLARVKGLPVPATAENVSQKQLQTLLEAASETPYARLISDQLLRSMAKARYEDKPQGHFGLVLADYCHFTSPIRRYPDLMIHRVLSRFVGGESGDTLRPRLDKVVAEAAYRSTVTEIRAMNAERACEGCYKAEYMRRFLGEVFNGMIVSVSTAGLFVELENTVCGLVPTEDLPEFLLEFDGFLTLNDSLGRPCYSVGQQVAVKVVSCDVAAGRVRFAFGGFVD